MTLLADPPVTWRRATAAAAHTPGAAAGASPLPEAPSRDTNGLLKPVSVAARGTAVITGGTAAGAIDVAEPAERELLVSVPPAAELPLPPVGERSEAVPWRIDVEELRDADDEPRPSVDTPAVDRVEGAPSMPPARRPERGLRGGEDEGEVPDELESALDPVEPAGPVASAKATGTAATAEPAPNATASAPTRPTIRAKPNTPGSILGLMNFGRSPTRLRIRHERRYAECRTET